MAYFNIRGLFLGLCIPSLVLLRLLFLLLLFRSHFGSSRFWRTADECSIALWARAAAGGQHAVLRRSDGAAVACGGNSDGQCGLPALGGGFMYTHAAADGGHAALLRSDGAAPACGWNDPGHDPGQCDFLALGGGLTYSQAAAGWRHTRLLNSTLRLTPDAQAAAGTLLYKATPIYKF